MKVEPQKEHEWLQKLVGEWTWENEMTMEPGKLPAMFKGTESVRSLGGLWVLCEGKVEMPGDGNATTLMTLGYDPVRKRYVGTFIGSMMSHLWIYDGSLDPTRKVLNLDAEGPSFTDEAKIAKYIDAIEFKSDDHRMLTSRTLGDDGTWTQFMTANYRRVK
jgi:hypothetical protein